MATPLITIGLVVRNGAAHLALAVESFLNQTFRDFELVIYDNASMDQTQQIAQRLARLDDRVRVVRHPHDFGVVRNLIMAAENAKTRYFCWAAHDDVRELQFLARLIDLLEQHSHAALACCAARNIDPDGARRDVRPETGSLRSTNTMTSFQRLMMYLKHGPGTPLYGVFRTAVLHEALGALRETASVGPPPLGLDMVFLAAFVKNNGLAVSHEPLLLFRRGGLSHRVDMHESLPSYLRQIWRLARNLDRAMAGPDQTPVQRLRLRWACWLFLMRYLLSPPMRRMTWHYLSQSTPILGWVHMRWLALSNPAFAKLRRRARRLPQNSRVVLFGAGKHTRRCLHAIRRAMGKRTRLVAICDDAADRCAPIAALPVIAPQDLGRLRPDLLIVSSDTYESALYRRAVSIAPCGVRVWCIYDAALETKANERSACATEAMNASISSSASGEFATQDGDAAPALMELMNADRC